MATTRTTTELPPMEEGQLVHTEYITQDPKALRTFLEKNFNWKFETVKDNTGNSPDYHIFTTPGNTRGGITAPPQHDTPIGTYTYIAVDDIKAAAKKVEKAGAKIVVPPMEIPNMGWFFQFQVKGGPVLACWQGPDGNTR